MANKNIFYDVNDVQTLIYQTVGAGSVCWHGLDGVFDDARARAVAADSYERYLQITGDYNDHESLV